MAGRFQSLSSVALGRVTLSSWHLTERPDGTISSYSENGERLGCRDDPERTGKAHAHVDIALVVQQTPLDLPDSNMFGWVSIVKIRVPTLMQNPMLPRNLPVEASDSAAAGAKNSTVHDG